jgi:hypothetical protein
MNNIVESKYSSKINNKSILDKYFEFIVDSVDKLNIKTKEKINNEIKSKYNNNSYYEIITTKIYEFFPSIISISPSISPSLTPSLKQNETQSHEYINSDHIKYIIMIFALIVIIVFLIIKYKSLVDLVKSIYKK